MSDMFKKSLSYIPVAPKNAKKRLIYCENEDTCLTPQDYKFEGNNDDGKPEKCPFCGGEVTEFGEAEDASKAPNTSKNWSGPTIKSWTDKDDQYSFEEIQESDWDRWAIVGWSGSKKLAKIDVDAYKMEEDRKKEIIEQIKDLDTRIHETGSGGFHIFYLLSEDEFKKTLPVSFIENVDDKTNGYVLSTECEGYKTLYEMFPKTITVEELPDFLIEQKIGESSSEDASEIEPPEELDTKFPCVRKITQNPKQVPEGARRYAILTLAGFLRDEGVPKSVTKSYLKDVWQQFKQPDDGASAERPWSDCEKAIDDAFNPDKNIMVGCRTVKRYLPEEYCEEDDCVVDNTDSDSDNDSEDEKETVITPYYVDDEKEILAEEIRNGEFMVKENDDLEIREKLDFEDKEVLPMPTALVDKGVVMLPDGVSEYGSVPELVEEIKNFIYKWVDISDEYREMSAWYVLLTWVYDRLTVIPYLRVIGDYGTGKTRAERTIGGICYRAIDTAGATTSSAVERMVDFWQGTILMNEADFQYSGESADMIKILNEGFEKDGIVVKANIDDQSEVVTTQVFSPKILATRSRWEDSALESRCLTHRMKETDREDILPVFTEEFYEEQKKLRRKLLKFRFDHYFDIDTGEIPKIWKKLKGLNIERRLIQAMISFAVLFHEDKQMFSKFKDFLRKKQKDMVIERRNSFVGAIIKSVKNLIEDGDPVTPKQLAQNMKNEQGFKKAEASKVGKKLRSIGLETKNKWIDGKSRRVLNISKAQLEKIFERYLPEFNENDENIDDFANLPDVLNLVNSEETVNNSRKEININTEDEEENNGLICERCKDMTGVDREAEKTVEISGSEVALCEMCLKEEGFKAEKSEDNDD